MDYFDVSDGDVLSYAAEQLVTHTHCPDELVHVLIESDFPRAARDSAAEKLIDMWENARDRSGITLDHLAYVGDHADEPYRTQANLIIRQNH